MNMKVGDVTVTQQPGAKPGFEWIAEMFLGGNPPCWSCSTGTTRDEALVGLPRLKQADLGDDA